MKKALWILGWMAGVSCGLHAQNMNTQYGRSYIRTDPNSPNTDRYDKPANVYDTIGRAVQRGRLQTELLQYNVIPNTFDRRPPANNSGSESQYPANSGNSNLNNSNIYKPDQLNR